MILKVSETKDSFIETERQKALNKLQIFFGFTLKENLSNIFIVDSRASLNSTIGLDHTENWMVGSASEYGIVLLAPNKFKNESSHKYSKEYYSRLIHHELCHKFTRLIGGNNIPSWLDEGICGYVSEQTVEIKRPKEFKEFLSFYDHIGKGMYKESFFAVEVLAKTFGEQSILKLLKVVKKAKNKSEFNKFFKKIFGSTPTYKFFNSIWKNI